MSDQLLDAGTAIKEQMFGPEHGQKKLDSLSSFRREYEEIVTRNCFAEVWGREGLDRATRSLVTIALLAALGRSVEVQWHTKAAIANGATKEQIKEVLIHTMIYAGVPAAGDGFVNADKALDEIGLGD